MVHFKAALWSVLVGLAVASAFPLKFVISLRFFEVICLQNVSGTSRVAILSQNVIIDTHENQGLLPRGGKTVDPAKIERMRKNLGPQDPVEEEEEDEEPALKIQTVPNAPQQKTKAPAPRQKTKAPTPQKKSKAPAPQQKTKAPTPKPTINVKDNSPAPEIYRNSNNGKVADSILELKRNKLAPQQNQPQQRKPAAPKRPSPRQPIQDEEEEDEEEEEEIEVRPARQKSGKKPQGSSLKQPSERPQAPGKPPKQQPEKKQPQGKPPKQQPEKKQPQGKQQRPSSKKQAPAPDEDEGANKQSPQTSRPGNGEKKQKPKPGNPKLPSPGPSKFQNKKAEKLGGPKVVPQPSQDDGDEEERVWPALKKQPQISPTISQGGPKDRSDGSRSRKQAGAKPNGSKFRKQGPVSEDDDYDYDVQGSERAAKDAVQTAGAPRDGPGPSQYRKINNAPRVKNQATAKRPNSQPGVTEVVAEDTAGTSADQPKAGGGGGGDNYFKWFRASEQRPTDFIASNRDGWKTKYPVPAIDAEPEAPPATGIEKLPSNKRYREKEQQEAAQKEQNRRASRRENF
ncbi:hypothetical protein L211DRAFT_865215 [Terfezia boudieri ATCC MYA-4762]|uniref:Uncharacterized protein n=1 Tax=Terfezia boudieri ATCC MYA-4762 TaxID=1051890 RepID=A0A3N4M0I9_9PEZI|nr:hypothetical protein L211DRAFT_865215 [Terfezia boudieri ATCC MYA-4762]